MSTTSESNFNQTTLLLGGDNATYIRDAGPSSLALTQVGSVRADQSTPFAGTGYYSGYFNGSTDHCLISGNTVMNVTSTDWTVEAWVYLNAMPTSDAWPTNWSSHMVVIGCGTAGAGDGFNCMIGQTKLLIQSNDTGYSGTVHGITTGIWNHVAYVRSGNNIYFYVNGVAKGSVAFSGSVGTGANTWIGCETGEGARLNGYISNLRVVKGTAVYTSAFTPPTVPLTAITNTSLLTLQDNRFKDNSTSAFTLTPSGTPSIKQLIPFTPPSSIATYGGGYFNGSTDYLTSLPNTNIFTFGTGDFTIEFWAYPLSSAGVIYDQRSSSASVAPLVYIYLSAWTYVVGATAQITGSTATVNSWQHIAVVRLSGATKLFVNGAQSGATYSDSNNYVCPAGHPWIGAYGDTGGGKFNGYISNVRVVKGTAIYTTAFTPPTTPLLPVYGTSLLTLQTNQAPHNNTFLDSSTNNFTVTRNGTTTQGTFSPFSQVGWGGYFNGSTDYLSSSNTFNLPTSTTPFTMEAWVYFTAFTGCAIAANSFTGGGIPFVMGMGTGVGAATGNNLWFGYYSGSAWTVPCQSATPLTANRWYHLAFVYTGSSANIYINGVLDTTASVSTWQTTAGTAGFNIGRRWDTSVGTFFSGYISNFRLVVGTAVYTTAFTPPTSPLTAITNTSLLTLQDNRFKDNSTNAFALTATGTPSVQPFSPFPTTSSYSPTVWGGGMYFNGTTDYLTLPATSALDLTADFTIESWAYATTTTNVVDQVFNYGDHAFMLFHLGTTWTVEVGNGSSNYFTLSGTASLNAWHHFAITRSTNTYTFWIDGVLAATTSNANSPATTGSTLFISRRSSTADQYFTGYISNFRIVKGVAVYTTAFTPPTPLTAIANTSLLLLGTNSGIYDSTAKNVLTTVGDAKINNSVYKYGTGSMYFDGNTAQIIVRPNQAFNFGTGNFTIECWVYRIAASSQNMLLTNRPSVMSTTGGDFWIDNNTSSISRTCFLSQGGTLYNIAGSSDYPAAGNWFHYAVVRNGTSLAAYINGASAGSATVSASDAFGSSTASIYAGRFSDSNAWFLNGYIDDLRITKGFARYTAAFTPQTYALDTRYITVDYLVVAGGGGGGDRHGGGGGGGGFRAGSTIIPVGIVTTATVGAGGVAGNYELIGLTPAGVGGRGVDSVFFTINSYGGGGGGTYDGMPTGTFGSGGGGGGTGSMAGSAGSAGQGNSGGNGSSSSPAGGGGGGANAAGTTASGNAGGGGGGGTSSSIGGASTYYAGGGGGSGGALNAGGSGGLGGGGHGSYSEENISAGVENSGGGGGASRGISASLAEQGRPGGSGIIVIRYPTLSAAGVGGTVTTTGTYTVHTFSASSSFVIGDYSTTIPVNYLIVAGGGAGAWGGGGGAGGLLYYGSETPTNRVTPNGPNLAVSIGTTYTITIGAGGSVAGNGGSAAAQGSNSYIIGTDITVTSIGGGAGGTSVTTNGGGAAGSGYKGANGGSGGGGGGNASGNSVTIPGGAGTGAGTSLQGFAGGSCPSLDSSPAGGGGGAGAVGSNGSSGVSGNGGVGLQYSISGTATYYAGGGGGGGYNVTRGTGGLGGGGTGGLDINSTNSTPGTAYTGGGGGGTGAGGTGGSGIVIASYLTALAQGTGGTISTIGTYTVHVFTASGTLTLLGPAAYNYPAPVNTISPSLSASGSTVYVGNTISSTTGTWTVSSATTTAYTFQWKRSGTSISTATSSTYTVDLADVGLLLSCTVTATSDGSSGPVSATSNAVTAMPVSPYVDVFAWGGGGSGGTVGGWTYGAAGGAGGAAYGFMSVSTGTAYYVKVGGGGQKNPGTTGAANGGGAMLNTTDDRYGGGGGGYSGIFTSSVASQASARIIAGGGGGGGSSRAGTGNTGGAGGGTTGQQGSSPYDSKSAYGGGGGTQSAGGTQTQGVAGSALQGGTPGTNSFGGGGGGYSDSNTMAGGGGGSGYYNPSTVFLATLYSGSGTTPGNDAHALRGTYGAGGAASTAGNPGLVVVRYASAVQLAAGGTVTSDGTYFYHTFTSNGTLTYLGAFTAGGSLAETLIVAGGGGAGSDMGGGGGGGGVITPTYYLSPGTYNVTVGAGGTGAPAGISQVRGSNGGESMLLSSANTSTSYSTLFNGSGDKLTIASSSAFDLSGSTWTIEFWMYSLATPTSGNECRLLMAGSNGDAAGWDIAYNNNGTISFFRPYGGGPLGISTPASTIALNNWYHVAFVCNAGSARIYINGTQAAGPVTISLPTSASQALRIGYDDVGTVNFQYNGYISNLRVVKGTALYATSFTPSTTPLTAISGTSLLSCQSSTIRDNSANSFAITATANPGITMWNPFNSYSIAVGGGGGGSEYSNTSSSPSIGGSGGGAPANSAAGAAGISGQGYAGATGGGSYYPGGGGGAGGVGSHGFNLSPMLTEITGCVRLTDCCGGIVNCVCTAFTFATGCGPRRSG
jgi:hypothetical protein